VDGIIIRDGGCRQAGLSSLPCGRAFPRIRLAQGDLSPFIKSISLIYHRRWSPRPANSRRGHERRAETPSHIPALNNPDVLLCVQIEGRPKTSSTKVVDMIIQTLHLWSWNPPVKLNPKYLEHKVEAHQTRVWSPISAIHQPSVPNPRYPDEIPPHQENTRPTVYDSTPPVQKAQPRSRIRPFKCNYHQPKSSPKKSPLQVPAYPRIYTRNNVSPHPPLAVPKSPSQQPVPPSPPKNQSHNQPLQRI
jgi:hypothetical protein